MTNSTPRHPGSDPARALSAHLGRRRLLQLAAALGVGGSVAAGASPARAAVQPAASAVTGRPGRRSGILQPGRGEILGDHYVGSTPDTVLWGYLPATDSEPVLRMRSGQTVTVDTVSHEGILEDQGRDPRAWFGEHGVRRSAVLDDAVQIAAEYDRTPRDGAVDGPHVVTGPIFVEGAEPGDVLKVEPVDLALRVPYGVVSSRHGKGALGATAAGGAPAGITLEDVMPQRPGNVSVFTRARGDRGVMDAGGTELSFALRPFMGMMGVATQSSSAEMRTRHSVPPTVGGGNIDVRLLGVGSAFYLPVAAEGAMFYTGDPHMAQGDGEVALTAMEGSLRATFRLTVCKRGEGTAPSVAFTHPFGETEDAWIPMGLSDPDGFVGGEINRDLDVAMRRAVVNALDFLEHDLGIERHYAYAYLSAASDFALSQVVDITTGVHAQIYKAGLPSFPRG